LFLRALYTRLQERCCKFVRYVDSKSASGKWRELAFQLDWARVEFDDLKKQQGNTSLAAVYRLARPIIATIDSLLNKTAKIIDELEVFVTAVERSAEILVKNKLVERVEYLDHVQMQIEQQATWILHEWIRAKEEFSQFAAEILAFSDALDDVVFERAMFAAIEYVEDKDDPAANLTR
jgi:hypothetical protein